MFPWKCCFLYIKCKRKHQHTKLDYQQFLLKTKVQGPAQAMLPALEAILGQRSAHSLATGPVMAEPADTEKENTYFSSYTALN